MTSVTTGGRAARIFGAPKQRGQTIESVIYTSAAVLILGTIAAAIAVLVAAGSTELGPLRTTVGAVAAESSVVTDQFLRDAESAGKALERALDLDPTAANPELQRVMQILTAEEDSVDGIFVGYGDGGFIYVTKGLAEETDGLRVKLITDADLPTRFVNQLQLDDTLQITSEEVIADDPYDPRSRPWYTSAEQAGSGWTEPYTFSSSGEPGITFFTRHDSFDELGTVLGVDMRLDKVTDFLSARQPGPNGVAAIVSPSGVAISGDNVLDPAVAAAPGSLNEAASVVTAVSPVDDSGVRRVSAYSSVGRGNAWTLVVSAVESDFADELTGPLDRLRSTTPIIALALIALITARALTALSRTRKLRRQATVDPETGLATRGEIQSILEAHLAGDDHVFAAIVEIDHHDLTNNGEIDPALLQHIGDQLNEFVSPRGSAGRTGSREYMLVIPLDSPDTEHPDVGGLQRVLSETLTSNGSGTDESEPVAVGWSTIKPTVWVRSLGGVLRSLDLALITATSGTERVVEYTEALQPVIVADQVRRRELSDAIAAGSFVIHFQPEIDLRTGEVVGAEALLRRRRGGNYDRASDFIGDLERLELLPALTHTILDQTIDFATRWHALPSFTIRINLAASELNDPTVMERLGRLSEVSDHQWCIELTERTIETLDDVSVEAMRGLVREGIDIALDDFGTGYSSMAELKRLPITTLKIDRSFVDPLTIGDAKPVSIASLIQGVATQLDLGLVAEGIENDEQRRALVELGCNRGQGWFMAPALPPNEFVAWVQERFSSG